MGGVAGAIGAVGSLFGGGGERRSTSTSEPFSGLNRTRFEELYPYLRGQIGNQQGYQGQFTAPLTDTERQGIGNLRGLSNSQFLQDTIGGKYLDPNSNPYLSKTADMIGKRMGEQFGQATNAIDARVNQRGFWGGSQHQGMMEKSRADLAEQQGNALNNLYGSAYGQERDRQFQALGSAGNLANSLMQAGGVERGVADTDFQRRNEDYWRQQGMNQQSMGNLLNYFQIGRNPTNTTTQEGGDNGFGNLLGWGLGGLAQRNNWFKPK